MAQYTMALLWLGCRPTLTAEGLTDALNRARGDVPSIGIAVIQGDRVTSAVSGLRRADGADPIHLDDRWHLGSNTKAMTATLLAILCEEGLLRWDLPLSEAFPHQTLHPALATATLADLVAHRAGLLPLLDETPEGLREAIADRGAPIAECAASAAWILAQGPASPVGEYRYSNAGYIVLGAAIERATRTSWETLLTERVFAPLGMDACHFGPQRSAIQDHGGITRSMAAGYPSLRMIQAQTIHPPSGRPAGQRARSQPGQGSSPHISRQSAPTSP